ncbi:MAG: endolytic transglycosylase MltG, partial [Ruminococcus sp.]|nr:endolytic transglycosylase MltG [Ruminococcus sp.]
ILEDNGVCSADDFIFYFNSGGLGFDFENKLPTDASLKFYRMEGYLFPDTYFFYENMSPEQVCQKIYLNFDNKMTDERYARMESLGLSLDQLITFASIVQKEAANTDTMTLVASVFWNRLRNSADFPLLQSDPTSNYAEFVRTRMDVYDKTIVDAYDTYVGPGLPPGAICNPGIEAIDAVLEAFESSYFYFIANIYTGQTYFSETLDEHYMYQEMVEGQVDEYIASSIAAEREAENNEES